MSSMCSQKVCSLPFRVIRNPFAPHGMAHPYPRPCALAVRTARAPSRPWPPAPPMSRSRAPSPCAPPVPRRRAPSPCAPLVRFGGRARCPHRAAVPQRGARLCIPHFSPAHYPRRITPSLCTRPRPVVRSCCGTARCLAAGPPGSHRPAIGAVRGFASRALAVRTARAP